MLEAFATIEKHEDNKSTCTHVGGSVWPLEEIAKKVKSHTAKDRKISSNQPQKYSRKMTLMLL